MRYRVEEHINDIGVRLLYEGPDVSESQRVFAEAKEFGRKMLLKPYVLISWDELPEAPLP